MNDLLHASTLFLIFALAVVLYGAILAKTGDKELLPYRAMHSVRTREDVVRVGRISMWVGLVIGAFALLVRFASSLA